MCDWFVGVYVGVCVCVCLCEYKFIGVCVCWCVCWWEGVCGMCVSVCVERGGWNPVRVPIKEMDIYAVEFIACIAPTPAVIPG